MALDVITLKYGESSGVETQNNRQFTRIAQLVYEASSTDPADTADLIRAQSGMFAGGPHPQIPFMWATRVVCQKTAPVFYKITADYAGRGQPGQSPLDEPPVITTGYAVNEDIQDVDANGKPMMMITGERFDPPIRDTLYDLQIRCQRNLSTDQFSPDLFSGYAGKTNSDTFLNFPPGTCRFANTFLGTTKYYDSLVYWNVTMGVTVAPRHPRTL